MGGMGVIDGCGLLPFRPFLPFPPGYFSIVAFLM